MPRASFSVRSHESAQQPKALRSYLLEAFAGATVLALMVGVSGSSGSAPQASSEPPRDATPVVVAAKVMATPLSSPAAADAPKRSTLLGDDDLGRSLASTYASRRNTPLWTTDDGPLPRAERLIDALSRSKSEGLDPSPYRLAEIERFISTGTAESLRDADALLSRAAATFAIDRLLGQTRRGLSFEKKRALLKTEEGLTLDDLIAGLASAPDMQSYLDGLKPKTEQYARLIAARSHLESLSGGETPYQRIPEGKTLRLGDEDRRVPLIRERLLAEAATTQRLPERADAAQSSKPPQDRSSPDPGTEAPNADEAASQAIAAEAASQAIARAVPAAIERAARPATSDSPIFDAELVTAVKAFQTRHGLKADGVVGPATITAMNRGNAEKIAQIELALERWRLLPRDLGSTYVLVNVPQFELFLNEGKREALRMKVAVGGPGRNATPLFSDAIRYMEFNPYWNVPISIAQRETVPNQMRSPDYLSRRGFTVFDAWGEPVSIESIDWSDPNAVARNYRFKQRPGPGNALGTVKFMFPNRHSVYLHDTNAKGVFQRENRAVSHGCVRVEKPKELANYILGNFTRRSNQKYESFLGSSPRTVQLDRPLPVHMVYITAWAESDPSSVRFFRDIYQLDAPVATLLRTTAKAPKNAEGTSVTDARLD